MNKYIIDISLQTTFNRVINEQTNLITAIEPLEPPMIQITSGRHVSQIKLGKFLKKHTILDDIEIKEEVENFKEINGDISQYKVKYSHDNYVEIYSHTLYAIDSTSASCMTGMDAVKIYDFDPRLELLTIWKNKALVARTLVVDRKEYIRLYLDHNNLQSHVANAILSKEGLTRGSSLEGIKLKYLENCGDIVAPYLDGCCQSVIVVNEEYLLVDRQGSIECNNTNGLVDNNNRCNCDNCGCSVHEDETCYIDDHCLCEECLHENYTYLESHCEYVHNDYVVYCVDDDSDYHIEDDDICYVESDNEYHLIENCVLVEDTWELSDDCIELVETTEEGEEYALTENAIEVEYEYNHIVEGFYIKEQLEAYILIIQVEIDNIQQDLFDSEKELRLNEELQYIKKLIDNH